MQQDASTYSVFTHTFDPWGTSNTKTIYFLKVVMLHIKLIEMEKRAPYKYIFCVLAHPQPLDGIKRSTHLFHECSHVSYQIKGNVA